MDKAFVAQKLNAQLQKAELALEAANLEYAALLTVMIECRTEAQISHVSVEAEFNNVAKAMEALNTARSATVGLHNGLGRLAKILRIPVRSFQAIGKVLRDDADVVTSTAVNQ
jgi:hypothetical protein